MCTVRLRWPPRAISCIGQPRTVHFAQQNRTIERSARAFGRAVLVHAARQGPSTRRLLTHATRGLAFTILATAGIATLFGCDGRGVHIETRPPTSSSTAQMTPSSQPRTERQRAAVDVVAQVVAYEHTLDTLAMHAHLSLDRLYRVSTQPDVTNEIAFLGRFRSNGDLQRGVSRVSGSRVDAINLPIRSRDGTTATAKVTVCLDVAQGQGG